MEEILAKKSCEESFGKISMVNSKTLATRVRVYRLKNIQQIKKICQSQLLYQGQCSISGLRTEV
jgi:hypothetical protein